MVFIFHSENGSQALDVKKNGLYFYLSLPAPLMEQEHLKFGSRYQFFTGISAWNMKRARHKSKVVNYVTILEYSDLEKPWLFLLFDFYCDGGKA